MKRSEPNDRRDAGAIEAEAMEWLAERDEGFAPGRAAAFDAWRGLDSRHATALAELEQLLAQLDGLAERRDEVNAHFGRVSPPRPMVAAGPVPASAVRWWRPVAWGGVAAALVAGAFLMIRPAPPSAAPGARYATAAGGYERARLDDGSTIELNTASAARVHFTTAERRVELESGEAHFEVAHDAARPFVVRVGGVAVRAVGTAFNVRLAPGAVEVTVTEGKIEVERVAARFEASREGLDPNAPPGIATTNPARGGARAPTRMFAAGERVTVPTGGFSPAVERLSPGDVRAALVWQRRVTDFSDTPLAEVAARFNRHNALQLAIAEPTLGARRIGGMFALDDVEAFVRLLERDGIIRAERRGDTLLLSAP